MKELIISVIGLVAMAAIFDSSCVRQRMQDMTENQMIAEGKPFEVKGLTVEISKWGFYNCKMIEVK